MYPSRRWRCTKTEAGVCGRTLLCGPRLPGLPSEGFPKALGLEVKASGGRKEEELRARGIHPQGGSAIGSGQRGGLPQRSQGSLVLKGNFDLDRSRMLREDQGYPSPGDFLWSHTTTPGGRCPGLYQAQEWSQQQEMGAPGEHDPGHPSPSAGIPAPQGSARVWLGASFSSSHPCHSQVRAQNVVNSRQPRDRHPVQQVAREVVCPTVTWSN